MYCLVYCPPMAKYTLFHCHSPVILILSSCVQTDTSCDSTGGVPIGYGDLGRSVDEASNSGDLL